MSDEDLIEGVSCLEDERASWGLYTESKGTQTTPTLFSTKVFDDPMPASLGIIRLEKSSTCLVCRTELSPARHWL